MSASGSSPSTTQYINLSNWAYNQYSALDSPLPTGFSYLLQNGTPVTSYDASTGFYGAALVSSTGQVVIAFEGTNLVTGNATFTAAQLLDDSMILLGANAASYGTALSFTQTVLADATAQGFSTGNMFVTGHSLGAAEAEYVATQTGLSGMTFGGPGIPLSDIPEVYTATVTNYVERGDPVGNYAPGGNEDIMLLNDDIAHFTATDFIGSYASGLALSIAAYGLATAETLNGFTAALLLGYGPLIYNHLLGTYASSLGVTIEGTDNSINALGLGGLGSGTTPIPLSTAPLLSLTGAQSGLLDIPNFDVDAAGAVQVSGSSITLDAAGQSDSLPLPSGTGPTFSLSSDGQGGTILSLDAASSGYVFAGSNGATVQGSSGALDFVGGSGAVSVLGGSGNTTLRGATGSNASSFLDGGSGTNLMYGGAGATSLVGGTGASSLVGGSGNTLELAAGSAPAMMVAASGATTINGTTGTGAETIFTGAGSTLVGLNGAADTVVGGSGVASVIGGAGADVFGFLNGHAGGAIVIDGLTAQDSIVFGGYSGDPITSEGVLRGSDLLTLSDGTLILLQGIDHKVF